MFNELFQHPTRLEEFCSFVVSATIENINKNLLNFLESIELQCRNVFSEFTTLSKGEANSASLVMRCYAQVLQEGIIELVMKTTDEDDDKNFSNIFTSSSLEVIILVSKNDNNQQKSTIQLLLNVKRNLAGLLSLVENYSVGESNNNNSNNNANFAEQQHQQQQASHVSPSHSRSASPHWRQVRQVLLKTAREMEANFHTITANNTSFSTTHILQKQVSMTANASIAENFRLPGNVFDQRRSIAEVGEILQKSDATSTTIPTTSFHIKTLLPFVGASSLREQIKLIVEKYHKTKEASKSSENEGNTGGGRNNLFVDASNVAAADFIPDLATSFQHVLGDVTNLLFRASSQTPKNSPNCAFLAFLICDVSFYLAPHLISTLQQENTCNDDDDATSQFLFSSNFFHSYYFFRNSHNIPNSSSGDHHQSHRWLRGGNGDLSISACTKFEVALGCAIDCLNADLEVAVGECCHKFETGHKDNNDTNKNNESHKNQVPPTSPLHNQSGSGKPFDVYSVCSEGMVQLLANVMNPLLSVFRFFSSGEDNADDDDDDDVTSQILTTVLRLSCSYWLRQNIKSAKQDLKILFQFCKKALANQKLVKTVKKFERRF